MAIGGALRAAMMAGNWAQAAMQSRRQARALANLNASGGMGGPRGMGGADNYLRGRGIDVDAMTAPGTGDPYMGFVQGPSGYMPNYATSPFGGVVQRGLAGGRSRFGGDAFGYNFPRGIDDMDPRQAYRGPIQAPYEGFRVWPGMRNDGFPRTFDTPPSWMGRGTPPPVNRTTMYDSFYGDEFPSAFPRSPYDEPFPMFQPTQAQLDDHYGYLQRQWNF